MHPLMMPEYVTGCIWDYSLTSQTVSELSEYICSEREIPRLYKLLIGGG